MSEKIYISKTKSGKPALWESGGGMSNTGHSRIVANEDGSKKTPIFVKTGGHLALQDHALFFVKVGDVVIDVERHHDDVSIWVRRIFVIHPLDNAYEALLKEEYHFGEEGWDKTPPEPILAAVDAAVEKSYCYHCRTSHYSNPLTKTF